VQYIGRLLTAACDAYARSELTSVRPGGLTRVAELCAELLKPTHAVEHGHLTSYEVADWLLLDSVGDVKPAA